MGEIEAKLISICRDISVSGSPMTLVDQWLRHTQFFLKEFILGEREIVKG